MGVLYILDEPSIGLHQRDNRRLIETLIGLRDLGNTVLVVEHDEETIRAADYIVDLGPGAGEHGGEVVVAGPLDEILACPSRSPGQFLSGRRQGARCRDARRRATASAITIAGAAENNLKDIDVRIPLGKFVCITGVSGSGKSSLMIEILYKRLAQVFFHSRERPGKHEEITGLEQSGQGHRHRPVAHRAHAALQPGHLYQRLYRHPRSLCHRAGSAHARLSAGPLLL